MPPRKFWISDLLRSFLVYSWGKIAKVGQSTAKPSVMFEAHKIKDVTLFLAAEAAKQLVIHVRHGKISNLILIAYCHP